MTVNSDETGRMTEYVCDWKPRRRAEVGYVTIRREELRKLQDKLKELSFVTREEVAEIDRWLA